MAPDPGRAPAWVRHREELPDPVERGVIGFGPLALFATGFGQTFDEFAVAASELGEGDNLEVAVGGQGRSA